MFLLWESLLLFLSFWLVGIKIRFRSFPRWRLWCGEGMESRGRFCSRRRCSNMNGILYASPFGSRAGRRGGRQWRDRVATAPYWRRPLQARTHVHTLGGFTSSNRFGLTMPIFPRTHSCLKRDEPNLDTVLCLASNANSEFRWWINANVHCCHVLYTRVYANIINGHS